MIFAAHATIAETIKDINKDKKKLMKGEDEEESKGIDVTLDNALQQTLP